MPTFRSHQLLTALNLAGCLQETWSQQLSGAPPQLDRPNLSDACNNALRTYVDCPLFLHEMSTIGAILDDDQARAVCTDACYSSLRKVRSGIETACDNDKDVVFYDNTAYPATFVGDKFLLAYNTSCIRDNDGNFCDPQILSWSGQRELSSNQSCSDCWLRSQAVQLKSPLGYDDGLASNLRNLAVSCGVEGYSFPSPTAYALNITATRASPQILKATAAPPCANTYTVKPNDDCNGVAKALNVSTYNLLRHNYLDLYCHMFKLKVGAEICVPEQCPTYTWKAYDTCESVAAMTPGINLSQFMS